MSIKTRLLSAMALIAMLGTIAPMSTRAADVPTYDGNVSRTRLIVDPSMSPTQLYLSSPVYLHLPGQSISTPTIVGSTMYQYTYQNGTGTLYAIKIPMVDSTAVLRRYGYSLPPYLNYPTQYAETPLVFHPSEGTRGADAQDSLTTLQGYQAIAVGKHLYSWAQDQWPSNTILKSLGVEIQPAPGDYNQQQVDMAPLITPPVPVRVIDMSTLRTATVSASMSVACSWDGGCTATPLGLPAGDIGSTLRYAVTQDFPSDTSGAITSDPVYVPSDPMFAGSPPAVAFGIASWSHPRIEVMDLFNGKTRAIGIGEIAVPVADAGMLTSGPGGEQVLVYHDEYGNIYEYTLRGALVGVWPSHSTAVELGVDGSLSYPVFIGSTGTVYQPTSGASQVATIPIPGAVGNAHGAYIDYLDASSPSTIEGSVPNLPWCKGQYATACRFVSAWSYSDSISGRGQHSGPGIVVLNGASGESYINNATYSNGGQLISARPSQYSGVVLDAGPQHDIASWSNSTPLGGAIMLWAPVTYSIVSQATPTSVPSGGTVTISAKPIPAGVTQSRLPWRPCGTGSSPVTANLTSSLGTSGYLSLTRTTAPSVSDPWSTWSTSWRLPPNSTGRPVTWTGTVSAVDKFCASASATVSFTEEPGASPPPTSGGPGLTLNPNPAMWSQNVVATLTPSAPSLPSGERLVSWQIDSATLRYPQKNGNWATLFPYYPSPLAATAQMTLNGHSASVSLQENWWDGGCDDPVHIRVCLTNDLYSQGAPGAGSLYPYSSTIPALTSQVTATYVISGVESHVVTSWTTNIDPTTGKTTKVKVTKTVTSPFSVGPQTASARLIVDGDAKDVVGGG